MAKRKRLTPAPGVDLDAAPEKRFARETFATKSALPPIAALAGDIAQRATLDEVTNALGDARAEGRLAEALPLDAIEADHLIRDRAVVDPEEMAALTESLRARGQQVPIEVMDLGQGRYGLISGWRRLTALRALATDGQGGSTVLAVRRRPAGSAEAYLAMVEENEIRADLGFWERGRIVARALEAGVFGTPKEALNGLFGSVPRAKRSKIGSFMVLAQQLDGVLRFPEALTERLGLALAKRVKESEGVEQSLIQALTAHLERAGAATPEAEAAALAAFLMGDAKASKKAKKPLSEPQQGSSDVEEIAPGIQLSIGREFPARSVTLSGPRVDAAFRARLRTWLESQVR